MIPTRLLTTLLIFSACGAAQNPPPSLTTIYNFMGGSDGAGPAAPLIIGSSGVLYGTTAHGGTADDGTVFSLSPPAVPGGPWTHTLLYSFQGGSDGISPNSRLIVAGGGVLYGTTSTGGQSGEGMVFSLTPPQSPGGAWAETTIHSFGPNPDGATPVGLAISGAGVLLGATRGGGASGNGAVFALTPPPSPGAVWTDHILYGFKSLGDGNSPNGVAIGKGGVLYGTTTFSGAQGIGTVFALTPPAAPGDGWTETVLHSFNGNKDGSRPYTGLVIGGGGVLYGTTWAGGSMIGGTVYSLAPPASPGNPWVEEVLHEFPSISGTNITNIIPGPLALGKSGALYGTTAFGGDALSGTAYVLNPPSSTGGAWTEVLLHLFTGTDGANPTGLVIGADAVLYGATSAGGLYGNGTIFALTE